METKTSARDERGIRSRLGERGQVFVIFVGAMLTFLLFVSLVIDVSWYWANSLRVQRAADAAALAGVIYLPQQPAKANTASYAEATKNGYTSGVAGAIVTPTPDPTNPRRMIVDIEAPVRTFFMRIVGIPTIQAKRRAKAEYILPVPMGSPQNYYGVFGRLRTPAGALAGSTGYRVPTTTHLPNGWTTPGNAYASDNTYATNATGADQGYSTFNFPTIPAGATITGVEVRTEARSNDTSGCQIGVALSWDNGLTFTTQKTAALTGADVVLTTGNSSDTWGRTWTILQFSDATFVVRVRDVDPGAGCTDTATTFLDHLQVRVHYSTPDANINGPGGETLNPQGFWGTMISQGAEDINGDAYLPKYETRTGTLNPDYKPNSYYMYGVEMPAGASAGEVWIFDPPFCATDGAGDYGTGDRWFGSSGGQAATSAFYELYDTNGTQWDMTDDPLVASSGNLFKSIKASDATLNGPTGAGIADCSVGATSDPADGRYWHNRWWQLASGLAGNRKYRVKVSSTDSALPNDQNNANGHNSFSIFTKASGTAPRVYGLGTMEAFSPLNGGGATIFYLAQIEAVHAGKILELKLWDPGDTGVLSANLRILQPTAGGYTPATFSWTSAKGTSNASASSCNGASGTNVSSVTTNTGGSQVFNGCWLTITVPLATTYSAPTPPGESEPGWWKIQYNMGGATSDNAFDLTTWSAQLRGNPVHLVVP